MSLNYYVDPKTLSTRNWPEFTTGHYMSLDNNHALMIGEEQSGGMSRSTFDWRTPNFADEAWDLQFNYEVWLCEYQFAGEAYRWRKYPGYYNLIEATGQQFIMCEYELQLSKSGAITDHFSAVVKWRTSYSHLRAFVYIHNRKIRIPRPIPPVRPETHIQYWQGNTRTLNPVRQLPRSRASLRKSTKDLLDEIFVGQDESDASGQLQEGSQERRLQTSEAGGRTVDDAPIHPTRVSETGSKRRRYEDQTRDDHDGAGPSTETVPRRMEGRTRAMREVVY